MKKRQNRDRKKTRISDKRGGISRRKKETRMDSSDLFVQLLFSSDSHPITVSLMYSFVPSPSLPFMSRIGRFERKTITLFQVTFWTGKKVINDG